MVGLNVINIIYEDNHLLVVEKPINIPVQEDSSQDKDLLSILKKYLKDKYQKPGNVYLGLVHRLDRPVGGIMVFAKTSKAASRLSEQIRNNKMKKQYLAIVDAEIKDKEGRMIDRLLKDEKTNTVKIDSKGKEAILEYKVLDCKDKKTLVQINLITGRSHQIRVQFASRGYPLYGDQRYNKNAVSNEQIALLAYNLEFEHPVTKKIMQFSIKPKETYPWDIFKI